MSDSSHDWKRGDQLRKYQPPYSLMGTACQALPALWRWSCPRCGVETIAEDDGTGRPVFSLKMSCDEAVCLLVHED